ncbi:MAG: restriction endonuclease subunit S [Burkholderiaceae bacterium]
MTTAEETEQLAPWTNGVPTGWTVARLDAAADVLFSNVDKHTIDGERPVRLCNYVDVYKNDRITGAIDFMEASADEREIRKFQIQRGDVLATKDSEEADDIAIPSLVGEDLPGVLCGYHLAMIRPRVASVSGSFLAWLHASKSFRAQYEAKAVGVTRFGLSQYAFRSARIPVPPLPEQKRIAAYLDASCAAIDAALAAKRRQLDTLDALRKTIIHRAVTQGLNPNVEMTSSGLDWVSEVPAHWQVQQIKRRCSLVRGQFTHRPRNDPALYDGPYPFVQTGDITAAGKYIRTYSQTLNELGLSVSKTFPRGTLVMSIAANIGDVAILDFEACFPDSMIGMIPGRNTWLDYLFYLMRTMKGIMLRSAVLSTQLNLNYVRIGTNFAAFPPKKEQEAIAEYLDAKEQEALSIVAGIDAQITTLTAYRKSLIHECVTGQRRVTDEDVRRAGRNETSQAAEELTA